MYLAICIYLLNGARGTQTGHMAATVYRCEFICQEIRLWICNVDAEARYHAKRYRITADLTTSYLTPGNPLPVLGPFGLLRTNSKVTTLKIMHKRMISFWNHHTGTLNHCIELTFGSIVPWALVRATNDNVEQRPRSHRGTTARNPIMLLRELLLYAVTYLWPFC